MKDHPSFRQILNTVNGKCSHKVAVLDHAKDVFAQMREEARQLTELVQEGCEKENGANVDFRDMGKLQFQLTFGEDTLIFNLHEDVFNLDSGHPVRKHSYVKEDGLRTFCGMVSIYNFLHSSIERNRPDDIGYLIGRVFVNADNHFFVEGKKRLGFLYSSFDSQEFLPEMMREVIMSSILHCMDYDLEVPPFEAFAALNVMQIQAINGTLGAQSSRPLGFHFNKPVDLKE